jgi:DNA-binding NarL/FixJ family response regulator
MLTNVSNPDDSYTDALTSMVKRLVNLIGVPATIDAARRVPQLVVDESGQVRDFDRSNPEGTMMALLDQCRAVFDQANIPPITHFVRVMVVDDHMLVREGLISLIGPQPDLQVVGEAGSVREAIALARELRPDVVLMDVGLPDGTGQEATRAILAEWPETKIIFLTVHDDDENLFASLSAGAVGYMSKNVHSLELLERLRSVARGDVAMSPTTMRHVFDVFTRLSLSNRPTAPAADLTERELEILRELGRGVSNRAIAEQFLISENTVKNHVHNILAKLHLHSRLDVADYLRAHPIASLVPQKSA